MRSSALAGLVFGLLVAGVLSGAGCNRAHLTATHGRAYHEVFTAQDANPGRKDAKSVNGLDSQEAAVIAGSYRKALAPKGENGGAQPQLLMVAPPRGEGPSLPPSVPAGQ
jgi:hypothetical protein